MDIKDALVDVGKEIVMSDGGKSSLLAPIAAVTGAVASTATSGAIGGGLIATGGIAAAQGMVAASSIPVVGGTIASGIGAVTAGAAGAGAVIGTAATIVAPVVVPAAVIYGLYKLFTS